MTFPYKIVFGTLTHRAVLRNRKRRRNNDVYIHVGIITVLTILAVNIFIINVVARASAILVIIVGQIVAYHVMGVPLFFVIVKRKKMHKTNSPLSGMYVTIKFTVGNGVGNKEILIENWVDRMPGRRSWLDYTFGNHAVMFYSIRKGQEYDENDPDVDEVLYGQIDDLGFCVHLSELDLDTVRPGPAGYRARTWDVKP